MLFDVAERYCPFIFNSHCNSCGQGQLRKSVSGDMVILVTMKGWLFQFCSQLKLVKEGQPISPCTYI